MFCAFEKNLRFVSNATFTTKNKTEFEEKDSREMRELCFCVWQYKIALLLYKGKKSTFTTPKEKAHVRRKSKRATPPNTVTQTVHHERAFKRVFFAKENARERDALAPQ